MAVDIRQRPEPLPREEYLYRLFEEYVDSETFDGRSALLCLVGQTACRCQWDGERPCETLARVTGVEHARVFQIFINAGGYVRDYAGAMAMARRVLGINEEPSVR